jgi:predicted dehydrogenase
MNTISRKQFLYNSGAASAALLLSSLESWASVHTEKKLRIAVIGCGSVSNRYIPQLLSSPLLELVSLCDIKYERAVAQNQLYKVNAATYPNIDEQLNGVAFDMLVTLTDMQVHGAINKKALLAGKHVWSEKPLANTYREGRALLDLAQSKQLKIWGAPAVVNSPQFAFMSRMIQEGKLGRIASAHGQYGHTGPTWSAFFYEKDGGSMPDLGVYNMATLTGLLGPATSVMAMTSIINPERKIDDIGLVKVAAEDNAHVLLEHQKGIISHIMCGFNYFDPHGHEAANQTLHTIQIFGDKANIRLIGYDWETNGVMVDDSWDKPPRLVCTDKGGYEWQEGARVTGESIVNNTVPKINIEHALHVLEIIEAARKSSVSGKKIKLESSFTWPIVSYLNHSS